MKLMPYLASAFAHAYNAKRANFMGAPVFAFTIADGETTQYNNATYDVPDQLTVSVGANLVQNQTTMSLKSEEDYDNKFSAEISGEYTGVVYDASFSSGLTYHGSLFTSKDVEYFVNSVAYETYTAQRNVATDCLTPDFQAALAALPSVIDSNFQTFVSFFDLYGTHFLYNGTFGGTVFTQSTVEKTLFKSVSEQEVTAAISAGYNGAIASGKLSASAMLSNSTTLAKNESSFSFYFQALGGTPSQDLNTFELSVPSSPVLLLSSFGSLPPAQFTPISKLCADKTKQDTISQAIAAYMLLAESTDGTISAAQPIEAGASMSLLSDSFVLAALYTTSAAAEQVILSASSSQADASVNYAPQVQAYVPAAAATLPVAASTSTYSFADSGTAAHAFAFTIADPNDGVLGNWIPLTAGQASRVPSAGFVLLDLSAAAVGASGQATLLLDGTPVTGCSVFHSGIVNVPSNSCCHPVLANQMVQIEATAIGNVTATYAFIPLDESITSFSQPTPRSLGLRYTAKNDGFLVASLTANDGDFGTLRALLNNDGDLTAPPTVTAGASVFHDSQLAWVLPTNGLCLPVSKGSAYQLDWDAALPAGGNPQLRVEWFDFFPPVSKYDPESLHRLEKELMAARKSFKE